MASTVISRRKRVDWEVSSFYTKCEPLKEKISCSYIRFYGAVTVLLSGPDGFWRENRCVVQVLLAAAMNVTKSFFVFLILILIFF